MENNKNETLEQGVIGSVATVVEDTNPRKNILNEIESIMLKELKFYSEHTGISNQKLNETEKMIKTSNVLLAAENLRERQYMNRTQRKENERKVQQKK